VTLSPFVGDLGERAAKSFAGALPVVFINYLVDGGLHLAQSAALYVHSTECAVGAALVSVGLSLWSRGHGVRGTASLTPVVEYVPR
jgi:hypothetical protein